MFSSVYASERLESKSHIAADCKRKY